MNARQVEIVQRIAQMQDELDELKAEVEAMPVHHSNAATYMGDYTRVPDGHDHASFFQRHAIRGTFRGLNLR